MSGERERDEVMARRLDWALGEAVGGERAPDVTQAVLARHAAPLDVVADGPAEPRSRWWVVAALVLFGVGAVVAVFQFERGASTPSFAEVPEVEAPAQDLVVVTTLEGIAALPVDARAVELRDLDDAAVAALVARCPRLQHLRIFASTASVTDAATEQVAKLLDLSRLELVGTHRVKGPGLSHLQGLPLLTELTLSGFDLDGAALRFLPRLPSLRGLEVALNQEPDVSGAARTSSEGIAAIAGCPGLRRLWLRGSARVDTDTLGQLRGLRELVELDLGVSQETHTPHLDAAAERQQRKIREFLERASAAHGRQAVEAPRRGVRDEIISDWPKLRVLRLAGCRDLSPAIGKRLRELCPRLVTLDLSDCPGIDDATVAAVLGVAKLRSLELSRCSGITPAVVPDLCGSRLTELILDETPWLTLAHAETLFASGKRVRSARQADTAFEAGMRALAIRYAPRLTARPEQVHSLADIEALPDDLRETAVEVRGLGDDAARLLARRPTLRRVAFVRSEGRMPLSDAGLAALAKLPHLQALELVGTDCVSADGLRHLLVCRELESLRCVGMDIHDAALELLPGLPALRRLDLTGAKGFGERGLAAVAACARLRELSLVGCGQVRAEWLAGLGRLTGLTTLDLTRTGGVTDAALAGLRPLAELRELRLGEGRITAAGAAALAGMAKLTTLDLSDNVGLTTAALKQLPTSLETLVLDRCPDLDADVMTILATCVPGLRSLGVSRAGWLDDAAFTALLQMPRLESVDASDCAGPTARVLGAVVGARALRVLDVSRWRWVDERIVVKLRESRPDLEVRRRVW